MASEVQLCDCCVARCPLDVHVGLKAYQGETLLERLKGLKPCQVGRLCNRYWRLATQQLCTHLQQLRRQLPGHLHRASVDVVHHGLEHVPGDIGDVDAACLLLPVGRGQQCSDDVSENLHLKPSPHTAQLPRSAQIAHGAEVVNSTGPTW